MIAESLIVAALARQQEVPVVPGDTLSVIAAEHGTSVTAIAEANGIPNPNMIYAGSYLVMPGDIAPGHTAVPGAPEWVPRRRHVPVAHHAGL